MSNAERKARKRAGIKFVRAEKIPTGPLSRPEKPLSVEQQARITALAMQMGRSFWESRSFR